MPSPSLLLRTLDATKKNKNNLQNHKKVNVNIETKIQTLKSALLDEINRINENDVFSHLKKKSLEAKKDRLDEIQELLSIEKYQIVFVGTVGAGKTTAICHLFNLIDEVKAVREVRGKKRSYTKTEALLSTGSGRTTISEVVITANENTSIEIEPYPKEKLRSLIEDFVNSYYDEDKEKDNISTELERAVRNIINLKKRTVKNEDPESKTKTKVLDEALIQSKELSRDGLLELALSNADLDNRSYSRETSVVAFEEGEEKVWLKQNFDAINKGEVKHLSIPRKIYVNVSESLLSGSDLSKFQSVIDTKGIDENANRPDLREYIEAKDTIILFTSRYNDAPETNVRELTQYYLSQRSKQYEQKFSIFVMPHKGEPEKENDGDGEWETGASLRREIIAKVYNELNLEFLSDNILFYDALRFYNEKGKLNTDEYDEEDVQEVNDETIEEINKIIERRVNILHNEVEKIKNSFEEIKNGDGLSEGERQIIQDAIEKIVDLKNLGEISPYFHPHYDEDIFIDEYAEYYGKKYRAWNTKDAIHRRFGTFEERGYDTYYDARVVAEGQDEYSMLKKFTNQLKNQLEEILDRLGNSHKDLQSIIPEIKRNYTKYYDDFISNTGIGIENYLQEHNENVDFWRELINRRGRGAGYNQDVLGLLRRKLKTMVGTHRNANKLLAELSKENWEKSINKLLKFFGK